MQVGILPYNASHMPRMGMKYGIGEAVCRGEDQRFLIGAESFVDDFALAGMCHAVAVMSLHALSRISECLQQAYNKRDVNQTIDQS